MVSIIGCGSSHELEFWQAVSLCTVSMYQEEGKNQNICFLGIDLVVFFSYSMYNVYFKGVSCEFRPLDFLHFFLTTDSRTRMKEHIWGNFENVVSQ